jgi:hypothetical protein
MRTKMTSRNGKLARLLVEKLESRWAMAASISLAGPSGVLYEGDRANFTLTLSEPVRTPERVFITTSPGTATYGSDYFAPARTQILFSPGETRQMFSIATFRDSVSRNEGIETFQVIASPATSALGIRSVWVRIDDYQQPPLISVSDVSIVEGNSGTTRATFAVTLSGASSRPIAIAYATRDGSATVVDNDYTTASGTLTFSPGETVKSVIVSVNGDRKAEQDETFSLVLSPPPYGDLRRGTALATIRNDEIDAPGFQITMEYDASMPAGIRSLFDAAAARWSRVIVGDLPGVQLGNTFIDDILIRAEVSTLPDPNTIAIAGFDDIRQGFTGTPANGVYFQNGLPYLATMTINTSYVSAPGIGNTIAHEMGHALGFGGMWRRSVGTFPSLVSGIGTYDPLFLGVNATREYNSLFGVAGTSVPLYDNKRDGIPVDLPQYDGSYGTHLRDDIFNNTTGPITNQYYELMTAVYDVNASLPGGQPVPAYLSRVTVGLMADLGYTVNYAAADAYTRPGSVRQTTATPVGVAGGIPLIPTLPSKTPARPPAQPRTGAAPAIGARSLSESHPITSVVATGPARPTTPSSPAVRKAFATLPTNGGQGMRSALASTVWAPATAGILPAPTEQ